MRVRLSNHQSKQEKNTQYKQTHRQSPHSHSRLVSLSLFAKKPHENPHKIYANKNT